MRRPTLRPVGRAALSLTALGLTTLCLTMPLAAHATTPLAAHADDCPAEAPTPAVSDAFAAAVDALNALDRESKRSAFLAHGQAVGRAAPGGGVGALYAAHVALLPRLRYVEGRAELERNARAVAGLGAQDRCAFRALLEDPRAGVDLGGLLAYKTAAIERLAGKSPARVGEMLEIFGALARLYHRVGARRHFFIVTYDFVDVFEPIRRRLAPKLSRRITELLTDFGQRRTALFGDLPPGTRPMND